MLSHHTPPTLSPLSLGLLVTLYTSFIFGSIVGGRKVKSTRKWDVCPVQRD